MDLPDAAERLAEFTQATGEHPLEVSAETGDGIDAVKRAIQDMVAADGGNA
jgi:hypothetical protein